MNSYIQCNNNVQVGGISVLVHRNMDEAINSILFPNGNILPGFAISLGPEMVMRAIENEDFMSALQSATFIFADGIGVVWALHRKGYKKAVRIPGCELWEHVMKRAGSVCLPTYLVGAKQSVLDIVNEKLIGSFGVNVVGMQHGFFEDDDEIGIINKIKASGASIVTVAIGSPKQEIFIKRCREVHPNAFYFGVGGTYDIFSGSVKRAPRWVCDLNMEWFYRLVTDPSRIRRQTALIKFLWLLLRNKL